MAARFDWDRERNPEVRRTAAKRRAEERGRPLEPREDRLRDERAKGFFRKEQRRWQTVERARAAAAKIEAEEQDEAELREWLFLAAEELKRLRASDDPVPTVREAISQLAAELEELTEGLMSKESGPSRSRHS